MRFSARFDGKKRKPAAWQKVCRFISCAFPMYAKLAERPVWHVIRRNSGRKQKTYNHKIYLL